MPKSGGEKGKKRQIEAVDRASIFVAFCRVVANLPKRMHRNGKKSLVKCAYMANFPCRHGMPLLKRYFICCDARRIGVSRGFPPFVTINDKSFRRVIRSLGFPRTGCNSWSIIPCTRLFQSLTEPQSVEIIRLHSHLGTVPDPIHG